MPQFYKGDAEELKYYNSAAPTMDLVSADKDQFFDSAYACELLGELIYDNQLAPLSNAIPREIFKESFSELFESFVFAGSFESYLTVFKKIFGVDVIIDFEVPGPGQLNIDIEAAGIELSPWIAKEIVDNAYVISNVVTQDGDRICFRTVKGFQSQYELEQMLFEMVPQGIFTDITLTLGD